MKQALKERKEQHRKAELGTRILTARITKGWTQGQLAEACGWDAIKSQNRISKYEDATNEPGLAELILLANALDVEPCTLAFGPHEELSLEETQIIGAYRRGDERGREFIRHACKIAAPLSN